MKSIKLGLICCSLLFAGNAAADDHMGSDVFLEIDSSFSTDYMWRGFNLYDGTSIQPSITAGVDLGEAGAISANVWSHLSAEGGVSAASKFTEVDYTLSYDVAAGPVGLSVGHIWYTFPSDSDNIPNTAEFFVAATVDTVLSPTLAFYQDHDEFDAEYYELGFSHTVTTSALGEGFAVTPFANFGFASSAKGVYTDNGFVQSTVGLAFDTAVGDIGISPSLNYTFESDDSAQDEFWVAVAFSYAII